MHFAPTPRSNDDATSSPPAPFASIPLMGFFGTFSSIVVGTGIMLFILKHWDSDLFSGLSAAAIAVTYMLSPVVAGKVSDKIGRFRAIELSTAGNLVLGGIYVCISAIVQVTTATWLLVLVMLTRAFEGITYGFFWPVLQACVGDVAKQHGARPAHERPPTLKQLLARYNTGWNAGTIAGQACVWLLVSAGMIDMLLVVPMVGYVMNGVLTWWYLPALRASFDNGRSTIHTRSVPSPPPSRSILASFPVAMAMILAVVYGYYLGGLMTTTTNLFERSGLAALVGLVELVRLTCQTLAMARVRLPARHARTMLAGVTWVLAGTLLLTAFVSMDLTTFLLFFVATYAVIGLLSGVLFTEAQGMMLSNVSNAQRGAAAGAYEAIIGAGFLAGPLVAGVVTEFSTYFSSYLVITVVVLVAVVASMVFASRRSGGETVREA